MTRTLAAAALALATAGCVHAPYAPHPCDRPDLSGCIIEDVGVTGNHEVPAGTIEDQIATARSSHPLGGLIENVPILGLWDRIAVDYQTLEPSVLERDLARVERVYKAQGYYEAHGRAARVTRTRGGRLRVEIVVEEGPPVHVGEVLLEWSAEHPPEKIEALVTSILAHQVPGKPFDEARFEAAKKRIQKALTDASYAHAHVQSRAEVDLVSHRAKLTYTVALGPSCTFGPITIEGAHNLPVEKLRQAIHILEGQPYSTDRIEQAQGAVSNLRVVGSVDAVPKLTPGATVIPVVFTVTPASLKTVKMGFGAEVGSRVEVHGQAGWDNRNFLGGLRHFSVEGVPGVIINPLTIGTLDSVPANVIRPLPELRLHSELAQPGFVESRTRGVVSASGNLYQLLPQDTLGYVEAAGKTGLEREFWGARVHLGLSANAQYDVPLDLQKLSPQDVANCGYNKIGIVSGQSVATLDLRFGASGKRDPLNPHSGFYLSNDVQVGGGSSADVRVRPDVRGYIPISKHVTLAMRFNGGVLYSFGGALSKTPNPDPSQQPPLPDIIYNAVPATVVVPRVGSRGVGSPALGAAETAAQVAESCTKGTSAEPTGDVARSAYIQLLQLRGFTSGGPTSNRGYSYNGVGPQEVVRGISPYVEPTATTAQLLPIATGGKILWEASVELRFPIYEKLGGVIFLDGSDVRASFGELAAPFAPHLSAGLGFRYDTPVGPVRADFGVRIPGLQVLGQSCPAFNPGVGTYAGVGMAGTVKCSSSTAAANRYLSPLYGQGSSVLSLPLAVSFAIGEAF